MLFGLFSPRPSYAFSRGAEPTITPLRDPRAVLGQRRGLSASDVARVKRLYGCAQGGWHWGGDTGGGSTPGCPVCRVGDPCPPSRAPDRRHAALRGDKERSHPGGDRAHRGGDSAGAVRGDRCHRHVPLRPSGAQVGTANKVGCLSLLSPQ